MVLGGGGQDAVPKGSSENDEQLFINKFSQSLANKISQNGLNAQI